MRPIKLTMLGFVSYGELTVIDFTAPEQNLFLVNGETGSGKSAIFDAITYALYGEGSSDDNTKRGSELRSRFGTYGKKEPFVELTFSEGGKEYTIRRTIPYAKPDGHNSTPDVELKEQGKVICSGSVGIVNDKMNEILGLSKKQFMQVSMLAQGEFWDLLRDKKKSKKDVYRHLFQTEVFFNIVEELKNRAKTISGDMDQIFKDCRFYASGIVLPEDYEDKEGVCEIRSAIEGIKSAKKLDITHLEAVLKGLENVCAYLKSDVEKETKALETISEQYTAAQTELNTAEALLSAFDALEEAERKLKECALQESDMQAKKSLSEKLTAAYEIAGFFDSYDNSRRKLTEAEQKLKELQDDLPGLREKAESAAQSEAESKKELEKQNDAFSKVEERVKQSLEIFKKINDQQKKVEILRAELEDSQAKAKKSSNDLSELEKSEKQWKTRSEKLVNAPVELADCRNNMKELEKLFSELTSLRGLADECRGWDRKAKDACEQYHAVKREYENKNREYEDLQEAYLEVQAGIIAREKLRPGRECPVCGNKEHPKPCVLPESYKDLKREDVEKLGREAETYRENKEKAFAESEAVSTSKQEKQNQYDKAYGEFINGMKSGFGSVPDELTLEQAEEILKENKKRLQSELGETEKAVEEFNGLQEKLKSVDGNKKKLKDENDAAAGEAARLRESLTAAETECRTLEKQKSFSSEEEAQSALKDAEQIRDSAQAVWDSAAAEFEETKSAKEKASTLSEKYQAEIPGMRAEFGKCEEEYRASMVRLGLAEDEWKDLTDKHSKEEISELQKIFTDFDKSKAIATGAADTARKAIGGQPRPDIEALRERVAEKSGASREATARLHSLNINLTTDERILEALSTNAKERAKIVKDYELVASLRDRLSGVSSEDGIDIETFVLRYYLDSILDAANQRFMEISSGEYELRMTDIEKLPKAQKQSEGLDLMAYSHNTYEEIEVRMLSGGESFAAAMSISLGTADVIQAKSAATRSEILFIDEGFGGLSEAYRKPTIRLLQEMAEGSRLVGIISHVTELAAAINDHLVVTKDVNGSHVKWKQG